MMTIKKRKREPEEILGRHQVSDWGGGGVGVASMQV